MQNSDFLVTWGYLLQKAWNTDNDAGYKKNTNKKIQKPPYVYFQIAPLAAASGSEDGTVRLWDLLTGACVHKMQGHKAAVTALTCTNLYVVSAGLDDRLCIYERMKGHQLHWIQMVRKSLQISWLCNVSGPMVRHKLPWNDHSNTSFAC